MSRKGLRRLDLWLPEDHPIWNLPSGRRAEKVRELLDLALRLEHGFDALRQDMTREIATLRDEIHALHWREVATPPTTQPAGVAPDAVKRFLAAFD